MKVRRHTPMCALLYVSGIVLLSQDMEDVVS